MSSWSEGYVSDINYTFGYYSELNPNNAVIPFLMAGLALPEAILSGQYHACELGFGQGVSVNAHATAGYAKWYATDFNPSQANFARHLSDIANNGALIADQGFNEFCQRDDLPEFDFIGLHGIWSWISDENRTIVVDFIRRKLKVGGILYISYNTLPGWSAPSPLRHLLLEHHNTMTSTANSRQQNIKDSLEFVEKVFGQSSSLTQSSPQLLSRLGNLKDKDPNYIAHEYLNKDWQPMYFADMQKWLEQAKLTFACSSNYLDDFNETLYNQEQRELMAGFSNLSFSQTVKDFILNKQFRKDFWVKGARRLNSYEQSESWKKLCVLLHTPRQQIEMKASSHLNIDLNEGLFNPVLDILQDHKIHLVREIVETLKERFNEADIFNALAILAGKNNLVVVQSEQAIEQAKPHCIAFNRYVLEQSRSSQFSINYLVSPISGGAHHIDMVQRWFLLAHIEGIAKHKQLDFAWHLLKSNGLFMAKEGKTLQDDSEGKAMMKALYNEFLEKQLPSLKCLGII
ncbi:MULTISPECIES: class I SAM-dependent methyltransferase [unclassified Pasteurella]|uniref:class I SAM-dependent methyltransferase n=1 Tax=unclassified Pasteurella TaxID=2621516 RepID=UPI0010746EFD|nr:class I SAM-dependent methyltransferase [Pasteurella sp. 19428wF3_WM03]TFU49557.1 methyltransferase [Pasteurella sp. WM03]